MEKKLTNKQKMFIQEYLIDLNATQAAIRAGYSVRTAEWIGPQLLTKIHVQAAVEKAMTAREKRTEIAQDRVLNEFARLGMSDIRKYFNADGTLKQICDLDDDAAAAVSSVEVDEIFEGKGDERVLVGYTRKIKLWDKNSALEKIGKHLKMFTDKLEVTENTSMAERIKKARERSEG